MENDLMVAAGAFAAGALAAILSRALLGGGPATPTAAQAAHRPSASDHEALRAATADAASLRRRLAAVEAALRDLRRAR